MKRLLLVLSFIICQLSICIAQDIQITSFEENMKSLMASTQPVKDRTGFPCAVIRFAVKDKRVQISGNLGVVKTQRLPGEVIVYVPQGTKRLTVRCRNLLPLRDWQIPVTIESKRTYDAVIELKETNTLPSDTREGHSVYVGAGYNILSLSGPSVVLGFDFNHHHLELGATMGLNKSDDLFFYGNDGELTGAFNYKAIKVQLSYGYGFELTDFLTLTPLVGATYNIMSGQKVNNMTVNSNSNFKNANSISGVAGIRLGAKLTEMIEFYLSPSFHIGLYKDGNCKLLNSNDNKIKQWTDGFNLNVGLNIIF